MAWRCSESSGGRKCKTINIVKSAEARAAERLELSKNYQSKKYYLHLRTNGLYIKNKDIDIELNL